MKKTIKAFSIILLMFAVLFSVAGCNSNDIYKEYTNAGATINKEHVFKKISYKKAISLVEESKTKDDSVIYIFYGSPTSSESRTAIQVYDEQSRQYQISCVYYVEASLSASQKTEMRTGLGIKNSAALDKSTAFFAFVKGELVINSTLSSYSEKEYIEIAGEAFRDILNKESDSE